MSTVIKRYSPAEERLNIASHVLGFILSLLALFAIVWQLWPLTEITRSLAGLTFALSLMVLYGASSCYHRATADAQRLRLRVLDHASIYIFIAGTYTPVALLTLGGALGWGVFGLAWAMALIGVVLKLFFTGRYSRVSTLMYVLMGWMIVLFIGPLTERMAVEGLYWLVAGGIAYTVGALIYGLKLLSFNHAIFHLLVLLGSGCHFMTVYFYIL